ncbi:MAG TPA: hypothetical protein VHA57_09180, partial [Actinomycetota bacterium]|nr:hypothetical protein [Actinomycetota bacterium]
MASATAARREAAPEPVCAAPGAAAVCVAARVEATVFVESAAGAGTTIGDAAAGATRSGAVLGAGAGAAPVWAAGWAAVV